MANSKCANCKYKELCQDSELEMDCEQFIAFQKQKEETNKNEMQKL